MKALASMARFRQALCSSSTAVGRAQLAGGQTAVPTRCMAVARAVRIPAKDKDSTEDFTVEQKVMLAHFEVVQRLATCICNSTGALRKTLCRVHVDKYVSVHTTQAKALDGVMKEVNARFGKGSLMKMGSQPDKIV